METNRELMEVEDQLRDNSLEEVNSCSSSILNSSGHGDDDDIYDDDDDYEDGINVTLLSTAATTESNEENVGIKKTEKEVNAPLMLAASGNSAEVDTESPIEATVPKKAKRLNGAAKKRLKYLVAHGHSYDDARVLAEKPFKAPYSDPNKRRRNAELSESNCSDTNPPKRIALNADRGNAKSSVQSRLEKARQQGNGESSNIKEPTSNNGSPKPSYSEALNFVRIGILPDGYPSIELTTQQLVATQKAILTKVAGQRKERIKPKFGSCLFRSGHMIIICKNHDTAKWLKATIHSIKPWEEARLIAVDEKDIPRPEILLGFFPRSVEDTNEDILAYVESQNEGLMVDSWRIIKRYTVKQHHVELVFTVDAVSMKTLEDCKFTVDYKFGVAYIRKKASTKSDDTRDKQGLKEEKPDDNKGKGNAEQSCSSSTICVNTEDAEMRDTNQQRTEASGESCNASADVEFSLHNADQCPPGTSGATNNGNSVLPTSCFKFTDPLGNRPDFVIKADNNASFGKNSNSQK